MPREFSKLTEAEQQLMVDAIPLITILIAGADGKMDEDEVEWAKKITDIRSYDFSSKLKDYFKMVSPVFSTRLETLMSGLPKDTAERTQAVSTQLAGLNPILHKLDIYDATIYYKNFRSFAQHVAEASGGVLGFGRISSSEAKLIELPMLDVFE